MDVNAIAPFVRADHGYLVFMEGPSTGYVQATTGDGLLYMSGMIHGSLEEMLAQVDYAFGRARTHGVTRVSAIVDARQPSFRIPDAPMHAVFKHLRRYEDCLGDIVFWRMPALKRKGMRLFALPLLPRPLRDKISFCDHARTVGLSDDVATSWDKTRYLRWRAEEERVALTAEVREFDARSVADAAAALDERVRAHRHALDSAPVRFAKNMKKRGRGGALGTTRWKSKEVRIDDTRLHYMDDATIGVIDLSSVTTVVRVDACTARVECDPGGAYLFAASAPEDVSEFEAILLDLKSAMASHRSSG